jgi:NADH dehydrogenase
VPGLNDNVLDVDTAAGARRLLKHLSRLQTGPGCSTFVILGAGFTGLELATELRGTLAQLHGPGFAEAARILLVDPNPAAPQLGERPRRTLEQAIAAARIETRFGRSVRIARPGELILDDGERIATRTVILCGGMEARALPLNPSPRRDELGRLFTDRFLRVRRTEAVFAAGDAARAIVDSSGRLALMSCQHAIPMGDRAGRNAVAALLGLPLKPYRQPGYVTCLDLGVSGALFASGWEREVLFTGETAKHIKRSINNLIAPPSGSADSILRALESSAAAADDLPRRLSRLGSAGGETQLAA